MSKRFLIFPIGLMSVMLFAGCGAVPAAVPDSGGAEEVTEKVPDAEGAEETDNETGAEKTSDESVDGSGSDKTDDGSDVEKIDDGTGTEKTDDASDVEKSDEAAADRDADAEENPYDGGPDWVSLADRFILPTERMSIEEAVEKYAITLVDGGRYADYEGDIGDVIPEYKNKDLDGDHKPDVIKREGRHYIFELTRKGTFATDEYSASPNEGEVIQIDDLGCRNFDEIEVVHYTFGTGGPSVSDTAVYSWQDGEWRAFPVIDKEGSIDSSKLQELIAKETGKPYEPGCVRIADVQMQSLLIDLGRKDGPSQTTDYRTSYLYMNFFPQYLVEGDYDCSGLRHADLSTINRWPRELTGKPVILDGGLQRKLNLYLSNFSEQDFEDRTWPYAYAHFALEWCRVNDPSSVKFSNDRYGVDRDKMFELLDRYFGTNFEEGDLYDLGIDNPYGGVVEYADDDTWYYEPAADGEMFRYNAFTVVTDAQEIKGDYDDHLRLPFKIYRLSADEYELYGIDKKYYSLSAAEAEKLVSDGKLICAAEGLAYLENVGTARAKDGYWLSFYDVYDE